MKVVEKIRYLREAGNVKRCHTKTIIGEYSVAHHTWNMLGLLRVLNPKASTELIWAVTFHDCGERIVGDISYVFKKRLNGSIDIFEEAILPHVGLNTFLSKEEESWLKGLDLLELALFCKDQSSIGNKRLRDIEQNIESIFMKDKQKFPEKVIEFYETEYEEYEDSIVDEDNIADGAFNRGEAND